MEKEILENIKIHYTLKHHRKAFLQLESEMTNDPKLARRVIEEYWDDYFKNRPLYI